MIESIIKDRNFILIALLIGVTASISAQLSTFHLSNDLNRVIEHVDLGHFEKANKILMQVDSANWISSNKQAGDFFFTRGYYNLFSSGEMSSLNDFIRAGGIYSKNNSGRFVQLTETFLIVDLYVKTHWLEAKKRALVYIKSIPENELELRAILNNILAACYCGSPPDTKSGHFYGNRAISYYKKNESHRRLISVYGIMAACLAGQPELAINYLDSAIDQATLIDHKKQLAFLKIRKANLYKDQGAYNLALNEIHDASAYFIQHPTEQGQLAWTRTIEAQIYAELGKFKDAYQILEDNRILSIEKRTELLDDQVNQLMIKYEAAQKQHKIEVQALKIDSQNQRIKSQALLGLGFILSIISIFSFVFWRNKKKQLDLEREKELAHQKKLIAVTEVERKRISQDLHDGVGQKLTGIKMAWEQMSLNLPDEMKPTMEGLTEILQETNNEVRQVSHRLMPAALRKLGLIPAIQDCLEQVFGSTKIKYDFDSIGVDERFDDQIEIGLFRIIQEIANNIIKHAEALNVEVQLYRNKEQLILSVEDDGKGFDFETMKNNGNGLYNIESRVKSLSGFMAFDKKRKNGSFVTIRIPLDKHD